MVRNILILFIAVGMLAASCGTDNSGTTVDTSMDIPDSVIADEPLVLSEEIVEAMIHKISSPIETAALIKRSGVPFQQNYLCSTDNIDNLNTSFKRALNLGILGADLGYLNMYNKTGSVLTYISSIHSLSEELMVSQFFDFGILKRLATNSTNLDSLMQISVTSFNKMDRYLRENDRGNISILVVTGVWVEGLYLSVQVEKEKHIDRIAERIGEQKIILDELIIVLKNYDTNPNFKELIAQIGNLHEAYKDVRIYTEYSPPEMIEEDGMMKIIQNEVSIVDMTDEQLANIIKVTEEVRNYIVNI